MTRTNDLARDAAATLSDAEIRATLYLAVGVTSESGNNAYRLVPAGDNRVHPARAGRQ